MVFSIDAPCVFIIAAMVTLVSFFKLLVVYIDKLGNDDITKIEKKQMKGEKNG